MHKFLFKASISFLTVYTSLCFVDELKPKVLKIEKYLGLNPTFLTVNSFVGSTA